MATSIGQAPLPPPVPASVNNIEGVDGIQGSADTALAMDASTHEVSRERRTILRRVRMAFGPGGSLQPFRLLNRDLRVLRGRYLSDWTIFNQLIFASAVFVFFTNLLPGITFAGDLYELTGKNYGTIEVVFSTGICGIIFSMSVSCVGPSEVCPRSHFAPLSRRLIQTLISIACYIHGPMRYGPN